MLLDSLDDARATINLLILMCYHKNRTRQRLLNITFELGEILQLRRFFEYNETSLGEGRVTSAFIDHGRPCGIFAVEGGEIKIFFVWLQHIVFKGLAKQIDKIRFLAIEGIDGFQFALFNLFDQFVYFFHACCLAIGFKGNTVQLIEKRNFIHL